MKCFIFLKQIQSVASKKKLNESHLKSGSPKSYAFSSPQPEIKYYLKLSDSLES